MAKTKQQCATCERRIARTTGRDICYACFYKTPEGKEAQRNRLRKSRATRRLDKEAWAENTRRVNLWRNYKLTPEQYDAQYVRQCGVCALCRQHKDETYHVDHCHDSGKVRGLLCGECNLMLGKAKDNTDTLSNAIAYLNNGGAWHG
jgi:hypothetical protein